MSINSGRNNCGGKNQLNGEYSCVNCDGKITQRKRAALYCSDYCTQYGERIRYARRKLADGTHERPDIAHVLQTHIIGLYLGGYQRNPIPKERRVEVAIRQYKSTDNEKHSDKEIIAGFESESLGIPCNYCRRITPRMELDHIRGPSHELENLQYLCNSCHCQKTNSILHNLPSEPKHKERYAKYKAEFDRRVTSSTPIRICDDTQWENVFNSILSERRRILRENHT